MSLVWGWDGVRLTHRFHNIYSQHHEEASTQRPHIYTSDLRSHTPCTRGGPTSVRQLKHSYHVISIKRVAFDVADSAFYNVHMIPVYKYYRNVLIAARLSDVLCPYTSTCERRGLQDYVKAWHVFNPSLSQPFNSTSHLWGTKRLVLCISEPYIVRKAIYIAYKLTIDNYLY